MFALVTFALATLLASDWVKKKFLLPLADMSSRAHADHLTQLFNRRYFQETIRRMFLASGASQPLSLLFLDIDDSK